MLYQLIINILIQFSLVSLIGSSFFYIFNSGKYYAIHHAAIITVAGYFISVSYENGTPLYLSIIISVIISTLLGILIEFILLKNIREKQQKTFFLIIASLGIYIMFQNSIIIFWGEELKLISTNNISSINRFYDAFITNIQMIIIITNIIIIISTILFFKLSRLGKKIRAVSENTELSSVFGINVNYIILWSFGIGSFIASISGILITFDVGMNPSSSFNLLFYGVIALIIGGIGNIKGLIFGALLLATAQHLTAYYIDSKWMDAITYIILILFLIWKPLGFSGQRLKKIEI
jgi:branched-chain amino acid transport system permease protein